MTRVRRSSPASEARAAPDGAPSRSGGEAARVGENIIIITDNWLRARLAYPGAEIAYRLDDVLRLPDGAKVAIVEYTPPGWARMHPAICAARSLAGKGLLEVEKERDD